MNDELKERLVSKEMKIEKSGSIAEAGISVKYVGTHIAPTREHWFVLTPPIAPVSNNINYFTTLRPITENGLKEYVNTVYIDDKKASATLGQTISDANASIKKRRCI